MGLAVAAVGNEFAALGSLPGCRCSWGDLRAYGLVRKQVPVDTISGCGSGPHHAAAGGAVRLWQGAQGHAVVTGHDGTTLFLLAMSG